MSRRALLVLVLLSMAFLWSACRRRAIPPPRPEGVPNTAVWAGGVDGGSFIRCSFESGDSLNRCSVYNDYTGRLEAQGPFKISGPSRAEDFNRFAYSAFDGKRIYLKDGSVLTPVAEGEERP